MRSAVTGNYCERALDIGGIARDMLGGNRSSKELQIMRYLCTLELKNPNEGAAYVHALMSGRAPKGLHAFF